MSAASIPFETIADGILFPEGPVAMADGSVLFVDMLGGTVERAWNNRKEIVSRPGGGPNGLAIGPDGAIYVCNNGGFAWSRSASGKLIITNNSNADPNVGRIERIDLSTGRCERIVESAGGKSLSAPNDIVFDANGGFWFTDIGRVFARSRDLSGVYYASPGANAVTEVIYGGLSYNGVGLSADGNTLYAADTQKASLYAWSLDAPGVLSKSGRTLVARMRAPIELDSLAMEEDGAVCVGMLHDGGIARVTREGRVTEISLPDRAVTNIAFGGPDHRDAFITLSDTGRLIKARWPFRGQKLHFSV